MDEITAIIQTARNVHELALLTAEIVERVKALEVVVGGGGWSAGDDTTSQAERVGEVESEHTTDDT